jgi:glycerol-3-phosphate dehydrogenase
LQRDDVIYAHCGLVPFGDADAVGGTLSFGKESRLIDHRTHGLAGLVTLIGIRYTTARGDAARALDLLLQQLPTAPAPAATASTPLAGGDIGDFEALRREARAATPPAISSRTLAAWLRNYGTEYTQLAALTRDPALARRLGATDTVAAEVDFAVREEMAVRLPDVVLRRTELGSGSHPGADALTSAALAMQRLLGWSDARRAQEIDHAEGALRHHLAAPPAPIEIQP